MFGINIKPLKMSLFDFAIHKTTEITLWLLPIIIISWYHLRLYAARENGPIENLQVLLLLFGAFIAGKTGFRALYIKERRIWQSVALIFFILVGREIGWGGEFFYLEDWIYKDLIYPFLSIIILLILYFLGHNRVWSFIRTKQIPVWDILVFIMLYLLADCAEHERLKAFVSFPKGELLEELAEMACYWCLSSACIILGNKTRVYKKHNLKRILYRNYGACGGEVYKLLRVVNCF